LGYFLLLQGKVRADEALTAIITRAWVNTVTGRTVATARLLLCPFACCTPLFSEEIGAITSPTEGYLSDGTQRANSMRNICRLAKKRWKIIPNSAIEPGPARWRHNCGEITSEKPALLLQII
jgi:hypothetical protein